MEILLYIALALATLLSLLVGFWAISGFIALIRTRGVPYVPLDKEQLLLVNEHVKLSPDEVVVDLGCGDGRVLRLFEQQGITDLTGCEVNYFAYVWGRIKNRWFKSQTTIYLKDFNTIDLSKYTIVFCYLLESYLKRMRDKFDAELRPGTKIISYGFEIKDWHQPSEVIKTNYKRPMFGRIFIYTIK